MIAGLFSSGRRRAALLLLVSSAALPAATHRVVFDQAETEVRWNRNEFHPPIPADWSGYEYLVLELRASSPQRFYLNLYGGGGVQSRQIHPLAGVWIRAAIPLVYFRQPNRAGFDMASVSKIPRDSFWMSTGGAYGPLNAVDAIGLRMQAPLNRPVIELRSARLSKQDPGSTVLGHKPVVDEFGQWIPADWPEKLKSLNQARAQWQREEAALFPVGFGYCRFGGYSGTKRQATGFFRVEQVDGRWWFIDPDGHQFFSTASNGIVSSGQDARFESRQDYFRRLPPPQAAGSFYTWNLLRRFQDQFPARWIDLTFRRMDAWGLNTIGNWSDHRLWDAHRKAYVVNLEGWGMNSGYLGLPDVYSPDFAVTVDRAAAAQCAPRKSDPYLLGYFIANEPPWPGRESLVVDTILDGPPSPIQKAVRAFLAAGDTPERRRQFIERAFERFLSVVNRAVRRHDPNHLNLGLRFGGVPPEWMLRASRSFDVCSLNVYATEADPKVLQRIYQVSGRPILIGEFHFGVPGRGLAAGLVQVRDQAERGVAYRYYVEQAASFPAFVGVSWFQWIDQPVTGRGDGENYNIGFVDVTDRPYTELITAIGITHQRLYDVHAGNTPPFDRPPSAY